MKVLSLFDGMACGMLAMTAAGVDVDEYDAYEIDEHATRTATHNFPMITEHGDVFTEDFTKYENVDYLIGGSPCTRWSIARGTRGRETEASGIGWELFSQYARALREARPRYFIYENNKSMSPAIREQISNAFGFDAVSINSGLVSAQERHRLYWVGHRKEDGTGYEKVEVAQPDDRGLVLRDILEPADRINEKMWYSCGFELTGKSSGNVAMLNLPGHWDILRRVYSPDYKSPTLTTRISANVMQDGRPRKVTVSECKRLQTIPEWYEFPVTDAQAYKMLGNGWTVEVIAHLIRETRKGHQPEQEDDDAWMF